MRSLVELLLERANGASTATAYRFLDDAGALERADTYESLATAAKAVAAQLQGACPAGSTALLLYPPGRDYLVAFFGCLMAGVIAVPAYPPDPSRLGRSLPRLEAIAESSGAVLVLTTSEILGLAQAILPLAPGLAKMEWAATNAITSPEPWAPTTPTRDTVAFIQYTSGSTGVPRGVVLTHGNLLSNLDLISSAFAIDDSSVGVSWLPPYHDMGLIGGILAPLYKARPTDVISPLAFLRNPLVWLRAISASRATISGGPNFAYEHCVRRARDEDIDALDLSSWSVAFNGAEPVRSSTMKDFARRFGRAGFRETSFLPCYGLAEATLIVTSEAPGRGPVAMTLDNAELERGRVAAGREPMPSRELVSSGRVLGSQEMLFVDPATGEESEAGTVGELWVRGESVAGGYWADAPATQATFGAHVGRRGPYLRTGDLGFSREGELFITGRLKDLIIVRGRNIYPQDLERVLEEQPAIRRGCVACFALDGASGDVVGAAFELDRGFAGRPRSELEVIVSAAVAAVAQECEVSLGTILILAPGGLPKTSSGKVQRSEARKLVLAEPSSDELLRVVGAAPSGADAPDAVDESDAALAGEVGELGALRAVVASILRVDASKLSVDAPLVGLGLDSLGAMTLSFELETRLGCAVPIEWVLGGATLRTLVERASATRGARAPAAPAEAPTTSSLSLEQEGLWFVQQLAPSDAPYNVAVALRSRRAIDPVDVRRWIDALAARHPIIATTYPLAESGPVVGAVGTIPLVELGDLGADDLDAAFAREARRPFRLTDEAPVRVARASIGASGAALVLVGHQIAVDFWSLGILLADLDRLRRGVALPREPDTSFHSYVAAEKAYLETEAAARSLAHWRARLAGKPSLELPSRVVRPSTRVMDTSPAGGKLSAEVWPRLRAVARNLEATPFAVALALFGEALLRVTGQPEVVVGSPIASRWEPAHRETVGPLLNTFVVVLSRGSGDTTTDVVRRASQSIAEGIAHAKLPFSSVVRALDLPRDPSRAPVFQALIVLDAPQRGSGSALAVAPIDRGDWAASAIPLTSVSHDVVMRITQTGDAAEVEIAAARCVDAEVVTSLRALVEALARTAAESVSARLEETTVDVVIEPGLAVPREAGHPIAALLQQAATRPQAIAIECGAVRVGYAGLLERVAVLAGGLRDRGVKPGHVVASALPPGIDFCASVLAIWALGAAYVPIDPRLPTLRVEEMLASSGARLVLAERGTLVSETLVSVSDLGEAAPVAVAAPPPSFAAYILFTSGTTGKPKGAVVSHEGMVNHLLSKLDVLDLTASDVIVQNAPLSFDVSVWQSFCALCVGGRTVIVPEPLRVDPVRLLELVASSGATIVEVVPSMLAMMAEAGVATPRLRVVMATGEALLPIQAGRAAAAFPSARLINAYGPTECSDDVSHHEVAGGVDDARVPIGKPIRNTTVWVSDALARPRPDGCWGEIVVGGTAVGWGYIRDAARTADAFRPDPLGTRGSRLYRTGDIGRRLADGTLEFAGRHDGQIKIRGRRLELGEIEAVAAETPGAREAVALAIRRPTETLIWLHVGGAGDPDVLADAVMRRLRARLPDYMVPAAVGVVAQLPRTPNGKIDRDRLPVLADHHPKQAFDVVRSSTDAIVRTAWQEVLGGPAPTGDADFFEAGGNSLAAMRLQARLRAMLEIDLSVATLLQHSRLADLVTQLESSATEVVRLPRDFDAPLRSRVSRAQERLWFLHRLEPSSPFYNVAWALESTAPLDAGLVRAALRAVAGHHEALRTVFDDEGGTPHQTVLAEPSVDLAIGDGANAPLDACRADALRPFDPTRSPPWRALLLKGATDILQLTFHHIIIDALSCAILVDEVAEAYRTLRAGRELALSPSVLQYRHFSAWDRARGLEPATVAMRERWRELLAGAPHASEVVADRPRPPIQSHVGATRFADIDVRTTAAVRALARELHATPFMVLLGALAYLVAESSRQTEAVIGTAVAGRGAPGIERLVGFFVNTIPIRVATGGARTGRELVARARAAALASYALQEVPFAEIVETVAPPRDLSRNPLFQILLEFADVELPPLELEGGVTSLVELPESVAKFDLSIAVRPLDGKLRILCELAVGLFEEANVGAFIDRWVDLLARMTAAPDIDLGDLWAEPAPPTRAHPGETLSAAWAEAVVHHGTRVALQWGDASSTYLEVDEAAERFAAALAARTRRGDAVAIILPRGADFIEMLLAAAKAGVFAVPLDPAADAARLQRLVAGVGAAVVVCEPEIATILGGQLPVVTIGELRRGPTAQVRGPVHVDDIAYAIFTSGSSGEPRPVAVSHRALMSYCRAAAARYGYRPTDRVLQFSPLHFDASIDELYPVFIGGGTVVLRDDTWTQSVEDFFRRTRDAAITVWSLPTAFMHEVAFALELGSTPPEGIRLVLFGGEAAASSKIRALRRALPDAEVVNAYGPTETTVAVTAESAADTGEGSWSSIGSAFAHADVRILNADLASLPPGRIGQIAVGGPSVALGYYGRARETAARFVPDPRGGRGARMYLTGDWARTTAQVAFQYLGRSDGQVKIRGHRIEIGEIEEALGMVPGVSEAAVVAVTDGGSPRLAAFVSGPTPLDPEALAIQIRRRVAEAALPGRIVWLESLPRTANEKIDRPALEALARTASPAAVAAPATHAERVLAEVWREVLGVDEVGRDDNFFALGGDSLRSLRVVSLALARGLEVSPRDLFLETSLEGLARVARVVVPVTPAAGSGAQARSSTAERGEVRIGSAAAARAEACLATSGFAELAAAVPLDSAAPLVMTSDAEGLVLRFDYFGFDPTSLSLLLTILQQHAGGAEVASDVREGVEVFRAWREAASRRLGPWVAVYEAAPADRVAEATGAVPFRAEPLELLALACEALSRSSVAPEIESIDLDVPLREGVESYKLDLDSALGRVSLPLRVPRSRATADVVRTIVERSLEGEPPLERPSASGAGIFVAVDDERHAAAPDGFPGALVSRAAAPAPRGGASIVIALQRAGAVVRIRADAGLDHQALLAVVVRGLSTESP